MVHRTKFAEEKADLPWIVMADEIGSEEVFVWSKAGCERYVSQQVVE